MVNSPAHPTQPCTGARAVMCVGTGSHAGKSVLAAALCRIYARRGYRVAPFKAQNLALNSTSPRRAASWAARRRTRRARPAWSRTST